MLEKIGNAGPSDLSNSKGEQINSEEVERKEKIVLDKYRWNERGWLEAEKFEVDLSKHTPESFADGVERALRTKERNILLWGTQRPSCDYGTLVICLVDGPEFGDAVDFY